jgi:1-deoxy-D-xylulose-5-phosphate reductoisomerase
MKKLIILGSTGSIGTQTLDRVRAHPGEFQIIGLVAHHNKDLFDKQVKEFNPRYSVLTSEVEDPEKALTDLACTPEADLIVNAISGFAGLMPTYAAVKAGKKIALANKESLVMAGELIMKLARETGAQILPIDSEPSAIWQLLGNNAMVREPHHDIEKIILTASGGPFFGSYRERLTDVAPEQALRHPTWKMGPKITIDSATLVNKAFEIIETRWLFDVPPEKIDVTIHRQSKVHSFVQFNDGNLAAILAEPDMRVAISYALFYPKRVKNNLPRVDLSKLSLTFEKPDYSVFEGPKLAYEVLKQGGIMPAVFCAADEVAVKKFLSGEISFLEIYDFVKEALRMAKNEELTIEAVQELIKLTE